MSLHPSLFVDKQPVISMSARDQLAPAATFDTNAIKRYVDIGGLFY